MLEVIWIELHLPAVPATLAGFILLEIRHGRPVSAQVRMLADWSFLADPEDRRVLAGMEQLVRSMLEEDLDGALSHLEQASNVIRCSQRLQLPGAAAAVETAAAQLAAVLLGDRN